MIEAFSPCSYDEALNRALAEAASHLTDVYDAHIIPQEFSYSEETQYRALIEVILTSQDLSTDLEEGDGGYWEMERHEDGDFKIYLSNKYAQIDKMVENFLKDKVYVNLGTMPDIILSRLKPEDLLEKIVFTDFQDAVASIPETIQEFIETASGITAPHPAFGENIAPEPEPE